jgi:hypothetical protein
MKNGTRAASFCSSRFRSHHLPSLFARSFPSTHSISFQNLQLSPDYENKLLLTSFSAFSDLVDLKYWGCSHFRFLCSLTLFPLLFFSFSSTLASSVIKQSSYFFKWIFSSYFRYWIDLLQKSRGSNFFRGSGRRRHSTQSA